MAKQDATAGLRKTFGNGQEFEVGEHRYTVLPILTKHVAEFFDDNLPISMPLILLAAQHRETTDKWLSRQVRDTQGEPVTLATTEADEWSIIDLRNCLEKMAGLSG